MADDTALPGEGEGQTARARAAAQTAMDERVIEDAELEKALEDRQVAKGHKNEAAAKFETLTDVVKDGLGKHNIRAGSPVRVGRFRISKTTTKPREVAFETKGSSRLSITAESSDED